MSSLAAARADGFHYPADFDASKGTLSQYNQLKSFWRSKGKSQPQSSIAFKDQLDMLISTNQMNSPDQNMTVRFPMVYDAKCTHEGCKHPSIGAGVRFNARKRTVGTYLDSIKIYEFSMKCPSCKGEFKIRTDPQKADYIFVSGIKKLYSEYYDDKRKFKAQMAERVASREGMSLNGKVKVMNDGINIIERTSLRYSNVDIGQKLLKDQIDQTKALVLLKEKQDERVEDNFTMNQQLRAKFREQKKELKAIKADPKLAIDSKTICKGKIRTFNLIKSQSKYKSIIKDNRNAIMKQTIFSKTKR